MLVDQFLKKVEELGIEFFTGVPDSLLAPLCDELYARYRIGRKHIVAANEGGAVGLAAGHYIATGTPALVYMQNSGIGNAVNPITSLLSEQVYGIPCFFVVGWRGEPGVKDEPQHKLQGIITIELLELLGIKTFVLEKETSAKEVEEIFAQCAAHLASRKCVAIVIKKGALNREDQVVYQNESPLSREQALEILLEAAGREDIFVSTTGKTSRELFELREKRHEGHDHDFLTVGSMGHALMIALGIALEKRQHTVWCIDGDGAALMHLGSMKIAAQENCENLIHVVVNNGAHESVGGMPVAGGDMDFACAAHAIGYGQVFSVHSAQELKNVVESWNPKTGTRFLEIYTSIGSRRNLGRPTSSPQENLAAMREVLK